MMRWLLLVLAALAAPADTFAGPATAAVRESVEFVARRFGKEAAEEGADQLTRQASRLAARYGDDGLAAFRRVGPRAGRLVEEAGDQGGAAVRALTKYGDQGVWLVQKPDGFALFVKYGDNAAEAVIKHPGAAEPLIGAFGKPAAAALKEVGGQNARRLGLMADDLARTGRADELLGVVGKYGDNAMNFVWRHKLTLAGAAALAAFLADPEPYLTGARDLTQVVAESAVKPLAVAAATAIPWGTLAIGGLAAAGVVRLAAARRPRVAR